MCPPAASLPNAIDVRCTGEEVFIYLKNMMSGSPLPGNVCIDVNPYNLVPSSDFTGNNWFLTDSKESKDNKHGFWKAKGDASKIFSDPEITGWIITFEFYEGQFPNWHKTDWVMREYTMTFKGPCEDSKATEVGTLCQLLSRDEQSPHHVKMLKISSSNLAGENCVQPSHVSNADNITGQGSTSKSHVDKNAETTNLTDPPQNPADDSYSSRDGYLELVDLNTPLSPSSSSDTMSSNECFDSLALLQDLESEINRDQQLKLTETTNLTETGRVLTDLPQNLTDDNYLSRGDYLELLDLDTPLSPSSSSETASSNECFDSLALLQNLDQQPKGGSCKFSISASLKPSEVVMSPDTSGPLIMSIGGSKSPAEEVESKSPAEEVERIVDHSEASKATACANKDEPKGAFEGASPSSSSSFHAKKGAPGRRKKTLHKYLCCLSF